MSVAHSNCLMDTYIALKDSRFYARHGVLPQERRVGGWFVVTLRVGYDWSRAAQTDDVADTVNYATLYELVKHEMEQPSQLLEHVAGRIADHVKTQFSAVKSIDLWLTKENPPMGALCAGAEVEMHWKR